MYFFFLQAPLLSGWNVTIHNTTFSSVFVQWTNLTNILNRQVLHYIVLLNRNNGSALANRVARGNQLTTEITGLKHSTNYTLEVFGIDGLGNLYKTPDVDTRTKNGKENNDCLSSFMYMTYRFLLAREKINCSICIADTKIYSTFFFFLTV